MAMGFGDLILLVFIFVALVDFDDLVAPVAPRLFVLPVSSFQGFHCLCRIELVVRRFDVAL